MRLLRRPPELDEKLRWLAEAEARSALEHAMLRATPIAELQRLRVAWIAANDRLANAIELRRGL